MPRRTKKAITMGTNQHMSPSEDMNLGHSSAESEEELWLGRNDHPLMNVVVLKILFGYVKPKDLKTCRRVNKRWNDLTLPAARATFGCIISGDGNSELSTHQMKDFFKLFGTDASQYPFTKFILGSFDPMVGVGKQWVELCGKLTKKIDLQGHFVENVSMLLKSLPKLEYFKIPDLLRSKYKTFADVMVQSPAAGIEIKLFSGPESEIPALKSLKTLEVDRECVWERRAVCPTFFEELLSAAQNISTILTSHTIHSYGVGLEILKILEKFERESRLQVLSLTHVDPDHLEILKKMSVKKGGLKLRHLSLSHAELVSADSWFPLFDLLKHSLVSLQVDNIFSLPDYFPLMPELKVLDFKIKGNIENSNMSFNGFYNSFPALQYLRLSSEKQIELELDEFFVGSECCPIMNSINLGNFILNSQTFERTLKCFPNLKELEMNVTVDGAKILQQIWTQMTGLERLKIYGHLPSGNNIESLVTGLSSHGIKKIRGKLLNTLKDLTMEERREGISALFNDYRTLPFIGNLTSLKCLTLNVTAKGGIYKPHLGDLTGYFGFYFMKNLRYLNVSNCMLSKACSEILITDMGLESWKFQSPGELEIIPSRWDSDIDYDWDKFPSSKF